MEAGICLLPPSLPEDHHPPDHWPSRPLITTLAVSQQWLPGNRRCPGTAPMPVPSTHLPFRCHALILGDISPACCHRDPPVCVFHQTVCFLLRLLVLELLASHCKHCCSLPQQLFLLCLMQ